MIARLRSAPLVVLAALFLLTIVVVAGYRVTYTSGETQLLLEPATSVNASP